MEANQTVPPEEFGELVRDALLHLYDLAYLQTHPLVEIGVETAGQGAGRTLRQALVDAIAALHPGSGVATSSRAWRAYRILEQRYVIGSELEEVLSEVALGRRQYHREHGRALEAVASLLWERWRLAGRWPGLVGRSREPEPAAHELARQEAEHLSNDAGQGEIDSAGVLRGVSELIAPLSERRGVELRVGLAEALPTIRGDRVALRQAVLSILSRLVGSAEAGVIEMRACGSASELEVTIIAPAGLPLMVVERGTAEARPFVETLGGRIEQPLASSQPGRWETRLTFPGSGRQPLLVVDNNGDFINLVARYLTGHNWEVVGAGNVDSAFRLARERRPRAILLDVVLPGRDGWDLLLELKRDPTTREIPVVICSVLPESDMAVTLGSAAYLGKPIDQRRLLDVLGTL